MRENEVRIVKPLGKIDYHKSGRKVNAAEIELSLRWIPGPRRSVDHHDVAGCVELALTFGVWNGRHTDYTACGAGVEHLLGYGLLGIRPLVRIAERWHLNGMKSADRIQALALSAYHNVSSWPGGRNPDWYRNACNYLERVGLLVHDGYKFGSGWLCEPLPRAVAVEVLDRFKATDEQRAQVETWLAMAEAPVVREEVAA